MYLVIPYHDAYNDIPFGGICMMFVNVDSVRILSRLSKRDRPSPQYYGLNEGREDIRFEVGRGECVGEGKIEYLSEMSWWLSDVMSCHVM